MILADKINWEDLESDIISSLNNGSYNGRKAKPIRLVLGILLLQYMHNLSDEETVRTWCENPYWQYFCGYDYFQWNLPMDSSSMTRWRKRLGEEHLTKLFQLTINVASEVGVIEEKDLSQITVDTTVMPKNIAYPMDTKLLEKARVRMVKIAKDRGIQLRQNYNLVSKKLLRQIGGYLHAKQMKRAKKAEKKFCTIVGRVMRDCANKADGEDLVVFEKIFSQANHLLTRSKTDKNKLYSLHEQDVTCISKGKAHKRYEFGCKVSLAITHRKGIGIITSAAALRGNPYDGHTLENAYKDSYKNTGVKVKKMFVDKGYKGHGVSDCQVFISGQRKLTRTEKNQLKRRQAIEPHIGHLKSKVKLGLCRLKGVIGDKINVILSAAAYNLRQILRYIRDFLYQILFCYIWDKKFLI